MEGRADGFRIGACCILVLTLWAPFASAFDSTDFQAYGWIGTFKSCVAGIKAKEDEDRRHGRAISRSLRVETYYAPGRSPQERCAREAERVTGLSVAEVRKALR